MEEEERPLSVGLVSSGSRGHKLLFYHNGETENERKSEGLLSKLPQRTVAEILAPSPLMVDRKFELRVDQWKFVGHPFSVQSYLGLGMFSVVFVLQSGCCPALVKAYDQLSRLIGAAILHEEKRCDYLRNQVQELTLISDEADTIEYLADKALEVSSLARALHHVLSGLQKGNPHVQVKFCDWSEVSFLVKPTSFSSLNGLARSSSKIRSYSALLLLRDRESIASSLSSSCNPSFHRFLEYLAPVKSLQQVSLDADIPLRLSLQFASNLVHWGNAMPIYPLSETNVYINSPTADTRRTSTLNDKFLSALKLPHSLPRVLSYFSSPVTLSEVREMCSELDDVYTDEKFIKAIEWLLQHEQIVQLHTYIYLAQPQTSHVKMFVSSSSTSLTSTPSPISVGNGNCSPAQHLPQQLLEHLSEEEIQWVMSTEVADAPEDLELFASLCQYFHGCHHLEDILVLENMSRSQLLSLIDKFGEVLITCSLPEH